MLPAIRPPITAIVQRTDVSCLCCGRASGYVQDRVIHAAPDADPALVGRFRCTWCGGRLISGDTSAVYVLRPLTAEEHGPEPKRGPKPKAKVRATPPAPPKPAPKPAVCRDCSAGITNRRYRRCNPCETERRREAGLTGKLLELLRHLDPLPTRTLAALLGCEPVSVRAVVKKSRRRGVPIVTVGKRYRLEASA